MARSFPLRCVGPKPQAELPSLHHHSWKETQITSSCEKWQVFCLPGRNSQSHRESLKGSMHKISLSATYPRLQQRGSRADLRHFRKFENSGLGKELREQPLEPLCGVIPHDIGAILLRHSSLFQVAST